MKNKVQDGKTISLKSESHAGAASGDLVVIGRIPCVAAVDNPAVTGLTFEAETEGVFALPKLAEGITQGTPVYWNGSAITAAVTGDIAVGHAWETALTGDTEIDVKIPSSDLKYTLTGAL